MAKQTKAQRSKSPAPKATSTPVGRQNVILERIEKQLRVVAEGVTMNREALERKIDELDKKLSSKVGALEVAVRQNSAEIRTLAEKLDAKADATRLTELEARVDEALAPPVA